MDNSQIPIITNSEISELKKKSPYGMPTNPTSYGMGENDIKKSMTDYILGDDNSLVSFINRGFGNLGEAIEGLDKKVSNFQVTTDYGRIDNTESPPDFHLILARGDLEDISALKAFPGELIINKNHVYFGNVSSPENDATQSQPIRLLDTSDKDELLIEIENKISSISFDMGILPDNY